MTNDEAGSASPALPALFIWHLSFFRHRHSHFLTVSALSCLGHSTFVILSTFVIRVSSFSARFFAAAAGSLTGGAVRLERAARTRGSRLVAMLGAQAADQIDE